MRTHLLVAGVALTAAFTPVATFARTPIVTPPVIANLDLSGKIDLFQKKAEIVSEKVSPAVLEAVKGKKLPSVEQKQITVVGTVSSLSGTDIVLKVGEGSFKIRTNAETKIVPRSGAAIALEDIRVGDRLLVQGTVQAETDILANRIQDETIRVERLTLAGTIASVAADGKSLVVKTKNRGEQTVLLNEKTKILKNGDEATSASLTVGAEVTVHSVWNRDNTSAAAEKIQIRVPVVRVHIEGTVSAIEGNRLRVLGTDGKTYNVDIRASSLVFGNYLRLNKKFLAVGDRVDVWARAETGSLDLKAYFVRNLSQVNATTRTIGMRDNGTTVQAETGDRILLKLGNDYVWSAVSNENAAVLAPISGQDLTFKAATVGKTELTLTGEPRCRTSVPACGAPSVSFRVWVNVVAQAS